MVGATAAQATTMYTYNDVDYLVPATLGAHVIGPLCPSGVGPCHLWITDGTSGGTRELRPAVGGVTPRWGLTTAGEYVYFAGAQAVGDGPINYDVIWRTDGTGSGTMPVLAGPQPKFLGNHAAAGSTLVYQTADGLWRTDGTGVGTYKLSDATGAGLISFGANAYFISSDAAHGSEVWKTDGTVAGTQLALDLVPGPTSSSPSAITVSNGKLFIQAKDGGGLNTLYSSDGTAGGTQAIMNTNAWEVAGASGYSVIFERLVNDIKLWRTDGTAAGTSLIGQYALFMEPSTRIRAALGNVLYFAANNQLWRTDGTAGGTGQAVSNVSGLVRSFSVAGDVLYGKASGGMWRSQGTDATTFYIPASQFPWSPIGNQMLYSSGTNELRITDGTMAGSRVLDVAGGPTPTFSFTTATTAVTENAAVTLTVTRTGGESAVSVRWTTSNGTAFAGQSFGTAGDPAQLTGVLSWADGDTTSRTIEIGGAGAAIPLIDDAIPRQSPAFKVTLSNASPGSDLGAIKSVDVTIADNDAGFVLAAPEYSVNESSGSVSIVVKRLGPTPRLSHTIRWTAVNGTAVAGQDFGTRGNATAPSGSLTFASTETSKTIVIPILQDIASEGPETFTIVLSDPSAGMVVGVPGTATVTITDDDIAAESAISFSQSKYLVMENGGNAVLTLHRAPIGGGFTTSATVSYATAPGTALATSDYMTRSGSVTWSGADASDKTITIPIVDNAVAEPHESFTVTITPTSAGIRIDAPQATVTIVDDDDAFPKYGVVPDAWIVPAAATKGWHASNDPGAYEGAFSLRSDAIEDGETSQIEVTRDFAAGNITFRARVSSEAGFDVLRFFVDGVQKASWSGTTVTGWQMAAIPVTAGSHTLRWSYEKDGSASMGSDAAWIDAVVLP